MDVLGRIWMYSILLFAATCMVTGQFDNSCATQDKIDKIEGIVANINQLQVGLPQPADFTNPDHVTKYNELLTELCTTYRPSLDEIAITAAECAQLVLQVPSLLALEIVGKTFIEFYATFSDIDEFCNCHPHLVSAWKVAAMKPTLETSDSNMPFSPVSNLETVCTNQEFGQLINALDNGLTACPPLYKESKFKDNKRINETKMFIANNCSSFNKANFDCAIGKAVTADFKVCMDNPTSTVVSDSSDPAEKQRCGRRECVASHMTDTCLVTGRDLYIGAVNLQRPDEEILIAEEDCEDNSATTVTMTTMTTLALILVHFVM